LYSIYIMTSLYLTRHAANARTSPRCSPRTMGFVDNVPMSLYSPGNQWATGNAAVPINELVASGTAVTPSFVAGRTLDELLAPPPMPNATSASPPLTQEGRMLPAREKFGLFLSVCTVLVSVQVLLPRTL